MHISDESVKRALLKALSDEQSSRVLASTAWKSKSVMDLAKECDIPHTSAYRLVNELRDNGLLLVDRVELTSDGKKYALYRSAFRSVTARFDGGKVEVEAHINRDMIDKVFKLFYSMRAEDE